MNDVPNDNRTNVVPLPFALRLASLKSCRQSAARLVREYGRGRIDDATFRGVLYGLQTLLAYVKTEKDFDVEKRLDALEKAIKEQSDETYRTINAY